jgi:hypothetical protein
VGECSCATGEIPSEVYNSQGSFTSCRGRSLLARPVRDQQGSARAVTSISILNNRRYAIRDSHRRSRLRSRVRRILSFAQADQEMSEINPCFKANKTRAALFPRLKAFMTWFL